MTEPKKNWPYLHPIAVHFPQALFPAAFASFLIYLWTGSAQFESGCYIMILFGLFTIPVAIGTGYLEWKIRYKGYMTPVFRIKIIGAVILFAMSLPAVLIRFSHPEVTTLPLQISGWLYLALLSAGNVACVVVGHYGGKLTHH